MSPTPPPVRAPRAVTLYAPFGRRIVEYAARLQPAGEVASSLPPHPSSWFVTHAFGTPAGGTYTEVLINDDSSAAAVESVLDAIVRHLAEELYPRLWAFHYRPDQYADSIERHGLIRRERVLVEGIEVQ
jgi:hypothetical protein